VADVQRRERVSHEIAEGLFRVALPRSPAHWICPFHRDRRRRAGERWQTVKRPRLERLAMRAILTQVSFAPMGETALELVCRELFH